MGIIDNAMGRKPESSQGNASHATLDKLYAIGDTIQGPPEAKALFQRLLIAVVMMVYDKDTNPSILQMLKSGASTDLPGALAQTTVHILSTLRDVAKGQPAPQIAIPLFSATVLLIAEVCTKSGIANVGMADITQAMQNGIGPLGNALGIPPDQIQQMAANLGQMGQQSAQQQQPHQEPDGDEGQEPDSDEAQAQEPDGDEQQPQQRQG